jgi:hypothetical protein
MFWKKRSQLVEDCVAAHAAAIEAGINAKFDRWCKSESEKSDANKAAYTAQCALQKRHMEVVEEYLKKFNEILERKL